VRVPVLCYHRVEVPPRGAERDTNFVTPSQFASHLQALASFGCHAVTISDMTRWQRGTHALPPRAVAITFDDAYDSVRNHAVPLLDSHGWPATIFVVSSQLGGTNAWDSGAPPAQLLDAGALGELSRVGHEIGSHSRNHQRIRGLDEATAHDELAGSRAALEQKIGAPILSFAFPYGTHDALALQRVRAAGYTSACTLKRWANGKGSNPYRVGRMSVGGPLSARMLCVKLLKLLVTPAQS
jgi:peptidoglycan/xylan/chitin deacetylase (PgdA/CDA1 family)